MISRISSIVLALAFAAGALAAAAQVPPNNAELSSYTGLFAAAARGDVAAIKAAVAQGSPLEARDGYKRTALHVAAYRSQILAIRALVAAGADPNALENDRYDIVTIASVANDLPTLKAALEIGCKATNITSRYDGTALIAAAHLGHAEVVRELIRAGAPLNHVNNLGWTAVIEAIVLCGGGADHQATLKHLIDAKADLNLADRNGTRPLGLARGRGYAPMVKMLEAAGAH